MGLRDYQIEAVRDLRQVVKRSGSAVFVLPTGAGKTVVASEIARLAAGKGKRTMLLVHRRELVKQAIDTLEETCPDVSIGVEAAGWPSMPWATLQVGSVQSIARRKHDVRPDIVIVDEAHHARASTWEKVLARWPDAKIIGLTATPERLDGKGLGEHFAEMVLGPNIPSLVKAGYLAPSRTLTIPVGLDTDGVKKDKNGEYRVSELGERVTSGVVAAAAEAYMEYAPGRPAIFFGINRDHSKRVCARLREYGFRAEHVDGTDSKSRRDTVMASLKSGYLNVVGNVDLISEGFDAPGCECVMLGAHTASVTRYLQQSGRAMRPGLGKTALILDLAGITHELGLPDEIRDWSLEDGEISSRKTKDTKPRVCDGCHTAFYGRVCPQCSTEIPLAQVDEVVTELKDARLFQRQTPVKTGRRKELMREIQTARFASDPHGALVEIATRRGYKLGWVKHVEEAWAR